MGLLVPIYEPDVTILASVSIATAKTTSVLHLGLPSDEDGESNVGVQFHFQVTPTDAGSGNTGFTVNFYKSYDGTEVDDVKGATELAYAAADVGAFPTVFDATANYLTENLGTAVRLELEIDSDGDRTLNAVVTARRWRWKHIQG